MIRDFPSRPAPYTGLPGGPPFRPLTPVTETGFASGRVWMIRLTTGKDGIVPRRFGRSDHAAFTSTEPKMDCDRNAGVCVSEIKFAGQYVDLFAQYNIRLVYVAPYGSYWRCCCVSDCRCF